MYKRQLKAHKDGRLVIEIERRKGDADLKEPEGWLAKKTKWVRIFETTVHDKADEPVQAAEYDDQLRALKTPAQEFLGWRMKDKSGEWVCLLYTSVSLLLAAPQGVEEAGWRLLPPPGSSTGRLNAQRRTAPPSREPRRNSATA